MGVTIVGVGTREVTTGGAAATRRATGGAVGEVTADGTAGRLGLASAAGELAQVATLVATMVPGN